MNAPISSSPRGPSRGSAFITVLLYTFLILTLVSAILDWSLNERRMNMRSSYFLEARNAAEALAEYGFSQVATQFTRYATVPSFDPQGSSPLSPPPTSFFSGSDVDTNAYSATTEPNGWEDPTPAFAKTTSTYPFCCLTVVYSRSRSARFATSP